MTRLQIKLRNYSMTRAFVFPGQGSQAVGMGKELADAFPTARHVFEEVDETLKQNLTQVMFEGPDDDLRLTENAQPALMAVSVAIVRVMQEEGNITLPDVASYVAGHSLGEYAALAGAGALSLADTARLLKLRGATMQQLAVGSSSEEVARSVLRALHALRAWLASWKAARSRWRARLACAARQVAASEASLVTVSSVAFPPGSEPPVSRGARGAALPNSRSAASSGVSVMRGHP